MGEGCGVLDGEEETPRLAKPLALSNASSLLLIGAGSPACSVATTVDAWVSGFAAGPTLARWRPSGLAKRVEIKTWDPHKPSCSRCSCHHAMTLDALRDAQIGAVLVAIFCALSPGGQLVMVDLVADMPLTPDDPAVAAWCALDDRSSTVPSERSPARWAAWGSTSAWPRTCRCVTCSRPCLGGIDCCA
ncbi:MAG TPA: hypothetical protein VK726_08100 [Acetobacteraceae bacterium]|nr:hypothetical protein [Acetobacteraceae bacterium]